MFRFFEKLVDPYEAYDESAPTPTRLWPFLWTYFRPFRKLAVFILLFTAVVATIEILLIFYAGRIVDLLGETPATEVFATYGLELGLIALFLLILRPALAFVDVALINQGLMPNIGTLVRWRSHRKVLGQSVGWFQEDFAGRIANRVMQTAPAVGEAAFQVFDALVFSTLYVIGALILLGEIDLRLAIPLVLWLAAYIGLIFYFVPRVGEASQAFSDARSAITGRIVDSYTNIQTVKLFAEAKREEAFAKEAIEHGRQTFAAQMRLITLMDMSLIVINGLLMVSVIGYAIWLWSVGIGGIGGVAAAAALVLRLNSMTMWIMWALSSLFQNLGVVREGMETIAQPIALTDAESAKPIEMQGGAIRFRNVRHSYGKEGGGGLKGVELSIAPGERIGLVGRSGAGKSTLVNLLLRFHDVEEGAIEIDGQNVAEVTQESLRANIGMVTQDASLLHRSVRDNIVYGRPDATDEEVRAAAAKVAADEFIPELADPKGRRGYDAHVGERGVKLSGGQRQRVSLARVVLKDAPILVLDEATSALDSEVEAVIQDSLYGLMEGKTVIAIAHRLSTIAAMDRIVVMDDGRIAETGRHEELLAQGGLYARFWARQSGGFLDVDAPTGKGGEREGAAA
ncbi:MAG: ABC transporter ATP-binding protein [Pseudomonadota bacterium]